MVNQRSVRNEALESLHVTIPPEFSEIADAFPPALRALLDAELAAGNTIAQAGSYFPAPPAGAFFKMTGPVTTRPRESGDGLNFRNYESSLYSGSFTDERGFYFILEPPLPPPPEPDMDAIRAAHAPAPFVAEPIACDPNTPLGRFQRRILLGREKWLEDAGYEDPLIAFTPPEPSAGELADLNRDPDSPLGRFERSMPMDYNKWHDGDGYDLEALAEASPAERAAITTLVLNHRPRDWRDVEALTALYTIAAEEASKKIDP